MKSTKRAFLHSLLAMVLCISMLLGTTFAWFTDSVTSAQNTIYAGNLKADVLHLDKENAKADVDGWVSLKENKTHTLFNYSYWEPGYVQYETIKIANKGNLAFQYRFLAKLENEITGANGERLADVIDVYIAEGVQAPEVRSDITDDTTGTWKLLDTLSNVMMKVDGLASGELLPESEAGKGTAEPVGESVYTIALHMQETAGNGYQDLSLGDFYLDLYATQYTYEEDSFGKDYDAGAFFPEINYPISIAADITGIVENGALTETVVITGPYGVRVTIPEGVRVEDGATKLTLSLVEKEESESNVTLEENEQLKAFDVHVEGIAEDNTVPMTIEMGEVLPVGLNKGNLQVYHVEDGNSEVMEEVPQIGNFTKHNQFTYEPETGAIALYMATFSEVTTVADTENAWNGEFDYSWYTNVSTYATEGDTSDYVIANADQLAAFGAIVGGMNGQAQDRFKDKIVKLISDVNLGDAEAENNPDLIFYPIGYYNNTGSYKKTSGGSVSSSVSSFEGTFDGSGHTISNFYQNTWEMFGDYNDGYSGTPNHYKDAMGLFGYVYGGTVKNLTVNNFSSDGEFTPTGVIAAYAAGNARFENIAITSCNPRVYNTGNGGIIGVAGNNNDQGTKIELKNITVDSSNKISALWGSWDVACGGLVGMFRGNADGGNGKIYFENCHVSAQIDVYNDVCANYQYYAYRYAGMMIGSVRHNTKTEDGKVIPNMAGISASGCTVNYGDWNDYYYCEFEKNTMASYSEDYQFSRIPHSDLNFTDSNGNGVVDADERASVTGCKHTHTAEENHQAVYLPFHQLFTGYSWGVNSIGLKEYSGIVTDLDITEGDQEESVKKFETKFTGDFLYRVGNQNTVSVGSLFAAKQDATINTSGVVVTVDKVDENSNVSGAFTANTTDWTMGTIKFSGTGVVKVTIQDYNFCTPTVLYLEVVDAYNRTTASFSENSVLLNDVSTNSTLSTSGVIYGNGFTINMENAPDSEKNGAVFHLYDGAVLKNVGIVGKEFTSVAMTVNNTRYGVSAVRAWGTVLIENSYISGCRSAVSVTGTELTIKDSVIANGVYANVDFRSGVLNLHNVTTVNEPHKVENTKVVGLGIVGNMTASAGRQLNITGSLTQYNWVSEADCNNIKADGVGTIFNSVFNDEKYKALRYTYDRTSYVNAGILSLCSDFIKDATTGTPTDYEGMDVSATIAGTTVNGYVWAPAEASTLADDDMKYYGTDYTWSSNNQGTSYIAPKSFDFSTLGLEEENGVAQISYESGNSYTLTKDIIKKLITAKKYNQSLDVKISMNGVDYTDKDIVFDAASSQTYTITYTIIDKLIYDKNGNKLETSYKVTKDLKVFATVVDKGADAPTFTFYYGTKGSASAGTPHTVQPTNSYTSTIKQVGEEYYIMPNVSATSANAIGSKTVDGVTIYYPIVDGINVRSGSSTDYDFTRYYPIFKAVEISDNGTEYTYSNTKEMPDTVSWLSEEIDSGNGASSLNDGFGLYNNQYLCKIQKKAGDAESGGTTVVKYNYTALDGNTYSYYVGYRFYDEDEGGLCVTPDTLITLADGTKKEIQDLTGKEQLLVWNHETASFQSASVAYIVNHDNISKDYEVITLTFADGSDIEIIGEHVFYDATLNKYVALDENAADYIGHKFVKADDGYNSLEKVKLVKVEKEVRNTKAYEVVSYKNITCFTDDILSASAYLDGILNVFDINRFTLGYNLRNVQKDIEKYGLYTAEDFEGLVTEETFEMYNAAYLKVAVGKGYITWDDILALIDIYFDVDVQPIK